MSAENITPESYPYEMLVGHPRTNRTWITDEQLRSEYVQLTDDLIRDMVDGVRVQDPETKEWKTERPDYVVWLDKSARPISWLIAGTWPREEDGSVTPGLWPLLARDAEGNVPEMPQFRFVNIDREQWVNTIDPTGEGYSDVTRVNPSVIRSLRSIFVEPKYKKQGLDESLDTAPAELDGKTVLIVDEVRASGRTLEYAVNFFKQAFPTSKIASRYWMGGMATQDRAVGNADLPVWYKEDSHIGRGVGNRDDRLSGLSKSSTQRLGRHFLSTSSPQSRVEFIDGERTLVSVPDPTSGKLRDELKHLSADAHEGRVLIIPSISRDIEDFDERAQRLNHKNLESFIRAAQELKAQKRP